MLAAGVSLAIAACGSDAPPVTPDPDDDPDPLAIPTTPDPGSLDELHARIIAPRCSGQPGLCHNGQFEPNLSTPGLTYAYVVNRPAIEQAERLRVAPGNAAASFFVDKLRNRNGVATQMPLGAEPLPEADIAAIEAWIAGGALREPGAAPAPVLNNPPRRPEIAIFQGTSRLDGTGPVVVAPGTTLTLRHSVQDFETPDAQIPFAAMILSLDDGRNVILNPASPNDPHVGQTTFDPAGPQGRGDQLNFRLTWTVPATLPVFDPATSARTTRPAAGENVTILAVYLDGSTPPIVALDFSTTPIEIR
jgi:hypothetical protein